MPMISDEFIHI